jgi:hypothetical protein
VQELATVIQDAIERRVCLELTYDGYGRVVEPHVLGSSADGSPLLRAWQVRGGHNGEALGWKLLDLREVVSAHATMEPAYMPRIGYRRPDPEIPKVDCRI